MHSPPNPLKFRYFRSSWIPLAAPLLLSPFDAAESAEPPPCTENFNPANGFKPAQRNLTAIFLQMAGSLEHFGTPEPYMRHVLAEHARIDARYKKATGKDGFSRPGYFTEEYVQKLVKNWNNMAPALSLETFAKKSGQNIRYALMGSWNMTLGEKLAVGYRATNNEPGIHSGTNNEPGIHSGIHSKNHAQLIDYQRFWERNAPLRFGADWIANKVPRGSLQAFCHGPEGIASRVTTAG